MPGTPKEDFENFDAVFSGKVTDIDIPSKFRPSTADPKKVEFDVEKSWKGVDKKTVIVETARAGPSCGFDFKKGESYLVYAYYTHNKWHTNICSRTRLISDADEDLKELGEATIELKEAEKQSWFKKYFFLIFAWLWIEDDEKKAQDDEMGDAHENTPPEEEPIEI